MIKNYLSIAFRNLQRNKAYAAINITGLAVGIAACLLLFIVVKYETSYDAQQPNYNRIVHVATEDMHPDGTDYTAGVPYPVLEAFRTDFPQIKTGALYSLYGAQITIAGSSVENNKKFIEDNTLFFGDEQIFDVFQHHFLAGDAKVLSAPNTVVLSQAKAEKYFGSWQSAMGKTLLLDNAITLTVSGIIENPGTHTDIPLNLVGSYITMKNNASIYGYSTDWGNTTSSFQIYALLPPNVDADNISKQLRTLSANKYYPNLKINKRYHFLRPLSDVHSDTRMSNFGDHTTSKATIKTLSLIGLLIIVMACINFINLSTAQAVSRSKEVGVRKVLGGSKAQLFAQMMGETFVVVLLAGVLSIGICFLAMPYIRHIISIQETLPFFTANNMLLLAGIIIVVTILSGFYPSLILSGFKPALALKNKITSASVGGLSLRRALVVTQFGISQVLIIGTIVAVSQMNFVQKADLGFNKDAVYVLSATTDSITQSRLESFKAALKQYPFVKSVSFSSDVPSSDNNWGANFSFDHKPDENYALFLKFADEDYFSTYGLQLAAGSIYAKSDTMNGMVINETLVAKLGLKNPNDAVGKEIRLGGGKWTTITGVVKDFKINSLREEMKPLMIAARKNRYTEAGIKLHTNDLSTAQASIQKTWDKYFPEYANTGGFFDERINNFYQQEQQLSLLHKIFAGLAIVISCLGLYGLVSFMAVQKVKEVGVRKVLGASVGSIVYLFSKEFTILVGIAFLIAAPTAYYFMNEWLANFKYKINIGAGVFVLAVSSSIIIAWLTVGYKAVKAALANPVKSLRSE